MWSNRQIRFFARVAGCCRLDSRSKSAQPRSPGDADATVATGAATHTYNRILQWGLNSRKVFEHKTYLIGRFCDISRFLFIFPFLPHFIVNRSLADYCWDFKLRTRHSIGGGDETGVRPRPPPLPSLPLCSFSSPAVCSRRPPVPPPAASSWASGGARRPRYVVLASPSLPLTQSLTHWQIGFLNATVALGARHRRRRDRTASGFSPRSSLRQMIKESCRSSTSR